MEALKRGLERWVETIQQDLDTLEARRSFIERRRSMLDSLVGYQKAQEWLVQIARI